MTVNFFNKDICNARIEIRWGDDNRTPWLELNPGDIASFDLDVYHQIPEGTNCWVVAYQKGTTLFKQSVQKFKYIDGRGFAGTFKFYMEGLNLALTYYRLTD